jgi:hypothetical protein
MGLRFNSIRPAFGRVRGYKFGQQLSNGGCVGVCNNSGISSGHVKNGLLAYKN